jgi:hypothetical protein
VKPIILLALVLAAACADDGTDSYAYITKVHSYITRSGNSRRYDHCDVVAKLPRAVLTSQPANGDTSLLGSDATTATDDVGDFNNDCEDHLHTWMHVTFSPTDRTQVHFEPPDPGITWQRGVAALIAVFVIFAVVRDRLRARRERRRA